MKIYLPGMAFVLALVVGCMDVETRVIVNADGSGTIQETFLMKNEVAEEMKKSKAEGGQGATDAKMYKEQEVKDKAADYGKDVSFVSVGDFANATHQGYRAVYAFRDVTKLTINQNMKAKSGQNAGKPAPAENIIWADTAPDGRYVITINLYNPCTAGDSHPFQLTALVGGVPVQLYLGTDDGGLTPVDGAGTVSSTTPTLIFAFDLGDVTIVPDSPDAPTTDPAATSWEDASITILDLLLLDCGVTATYTNMGEVEGGWNWIATTPSGDADFTILDPTGAWYVQANNELAGELAVSCGFYTP